MPSASLQPAEKPLRLLVVDDDEGRRTMLSRFFAKHAFVVEQHVDGRGVVERITSFQPDVVLLDVMMPGETGVQVCRRVRATEAIRATPIILMTAAAFDEESIVTGLSCGADDYVVMPSSLAEIHARVRVQIRNARERDLLRRVLDDRERLKDEALRDPLTGIANRRACDRMLAAALTREGAVALVLMDIDRFKRVNDTHGHPVGDAVLQHVAAVLERTTRRGDLVARFGGEEFCVIAPGAGHAVGASVGERFRAAIEQAELPAELPVRSVTVSVGVATWEGRPGTYAPESLVQAADAPLYLAKGGGRNRVETVRV